MKYGSLTAVMLVMAAPAFAQQTANPGVAAPDTPRTDTLPADHPNTADQLFTRQALIGGQAEVQLAALTASHAQSDTVKQFAKSTSSVRARTKKTYADLLTGAVSRAPRPGV
jgi:predicted outer membrane protein